TCRLPKALAPLPGTGLLSLGDFVRPCSALPRRARGSRVFCRARGPRPLRTWQLVQPLASGAYAGPFARVEYQNDSSKFATAHADHMVRSECAFRRKWERNGMS